MKWEKEIKFLTPMFCRGAYQDTPELRAPSIRGMVRWWFRALGGTRDEEKEIFGGLNRFGERTRGKAIASRLVVRVSSLQTKRAVPDPLTLPHKQARQGSPQAAFAAGGRFLVQVSSRLGGLSPGLAQKVTRSLEVWLLLGALGLRANRAGGSVWPADGSAPQTPAALRQRLDQCDCGWAVSLAGGNLG
jgi:CRISPR/Cas system CMR-associated protein Cmr1 (group 7 of RAMP superfamily)